MGYSGRHWRRGEKERGVGGKCFWGNPPAVRSVTATTVWTPLRVTARLCGGWGTGGDGGVRGEGRGEQTGGVYGNQHARNYSERKMT